jgi:hypothetical protein
MCFVELFNTNPIARLGMMNNADTAAHRRKNFLKLKTGAKESTSASLATTTILQFKEKSPVQ